MINMLKSWELAIKDKVGASQFKMSSLDPSKKHAFESTEKVKSREFWIGLDKD
jgi:hypothetical protein